MSVFVVSAPSGAGKTTLNRRLISEFTDLVEVSVSHTTRPARERELEGVHYHFTDRAHFQKMIDDEAFIEWAEVHGNFYGTSFSELERIDRMGKHAILEIDVQGWSKARHQLKDACSVFIHPPDLNSLWKRLEQRGSDEIEARWLRLQNAHKEILASVDYRYHIVNADLDVAYEQLKAIVIDGKSEGIGLADGNDFRAKLDEEYNHADWIHQLRRSLG